MMTDIRFSALQSWPDLMNYLRRLGPHGILWHFMRGADPSLTPEEGSATSYYASLPMSLSVPAIAGLYGLPPVLGGWQETMALEIQNIVESAIKWRDVSFGSSIPMPGQASLVSGLAEVWTTTGFDFGRIPGEAAALAILPRQEVVTALMSLLDTGMPAALVGHLARNHVRLRSAGCFVRMCDTTFRDETGWPVEGFLSCGYDDDAPSAPDFCFVVPPETMQDIRTTWPTHLHAVITYSRTRDRGESAWMAVEGVDIEEACRGRLRGDIAVGWSEAEEAVSALAPALLAGWIETLPAEIDPARHVVQRRPAPAQLETDDLSW